MAAADKLLLAVYAPHALKVFVIGEFNDWDETSHEMERLEPEEAGIYELFVPCLFHCSFAAAGQPSGFPAVFPTLQNPSL